MPARIFSFLLEGVGVVQRVGNAVSHLQIGDHVAMSYASCGQCTSCHAGHTAYCDEHGSLNFSGSNADGTLSHSFDENDSSSDDTHHHHHPHPPVAKESIMTQPLYGSFFQQSSFATIANCPTRNLVKVDRSLGERYKQRGILSSLF